MKHRNLLATVALTVSCFSCSMDRNVSAAELTLEEARSYAAPIVDAKRVKGLSVGIIHGDRQITYHLGTRGEGKGVANDDTLYGIGSITKVFTGILLADAALKEKDLLQSEASVPGAQPLPKKNGKAITWLQLSTHQSGLPRLATNMNIVQPSDPYANYDSKLASAFLASHQLKRAPGEQTEYSNFAVSWLGYLLAKRANTSYAELLGQTIFQPLGMKASTIALSAEDQRSLAIPHLPNGDQTNVWGFADLPGAGGIRSSIRDLMQFADANLHPTDTPVGKAIELAWKKHADPKSSGFPMGLGWMIARDGETHFHNGGTGGYSSAIFINRRLDAAVIVLTNSSVRKEVDTLAEQLIQRLAGMKVTPQEFAQEASVDVEKMKRLEGRYQLVPGFVFDVNVKDGKLMVGVTNQPTHQVYPKSDTVWFYKVVDAQLTFKLGAGGKAVSLELFQNGVRQTAKRMR